jgi:hypothetical protein
MVAEYHITSRSPRRRRGTTQPEATEQRQGHLPDAAALSAMIQTLWRKEYQLGVYAPVEELCLNLDELDLDALRALRARILLRLHNRIAEGLPQG